MEKMQRYCRECHHSFTPKHNPHQHYCAQQACQNARKRDWRKQKRMSDVDYQENQRRVNQQWQQRHPDYWRQYRKTHPAYTQRNREQAKLRRRQVRQLRARQASQSNASQFAKSDASRPTKTTPEPITPGTYRLMPASHPGFAKSDALLVTLTVLAGV